MMAAVPGSSPLARGLPPLPGRRGDRARIIPARAGFTGRFSSVGPRTSDHPRSRGVYMSTTPRGMPILGSSPLARGLQMIGQAPDLHPGIIPARAGFTPLATFKRGMLEDHPRSRGVYAVAVARSGLIQGSSPLARGLRIRIRVEKATIRIIPARAGFTRRRPGPTGPWSDHPRSRGVYYPKVTNIIFDEGSSPLARGLRGPVPHLRAAVGIIPARAGFTRTTRCRGFSGWDHPRSRGVYVLGPGL